MLVLSRHEGDRILIGDDIEVVVFMIDRNVVRIGVQAPKDVKIWRAEIAPKRPEGDSCEHCPADGGGCPVCALRGTVFGEKGA